MAQAVIEKRLRKRKKPYYSAEGDGWWNEFAQYFEEPSGLYEWLCLEEHKEAKHLRQNTDLTHVRFSLSPNHIEQLLEDARILSRTARTYESFNAKQTARWYMGRVMSILDYASRRIRPQHKELQELVDGGIEILLDRMRRV